MSMHLGQIVAVELAYVAPKQFGVGQYARNSKLKIARLAQAEIHDALLLFVALCPLPLSVQIRVGQGSLRKQDTGDKAT